MRSRKKSELVRPKKKLRKVSLGKATREILRHSARAVTLSITTRLLKSAIIAVKTPSTTR